MAGKAAHVHPDLCDRNLRRCAIDARDGVKELHFIGERDDHPLYLGTQLTDGLIEVFDTANRELGFEWAKTELSGLADRPLQEIADRLLAGARKHGAQLDDQTVLLIRRSTLATPA